MKPLWREEFSVFDEDQQYVTRRQLTKFLVLTSLGMFVGNLWLLVRAWFTRQTVYPMLRVARESDLAVGQCRVFHYPTPADPCLLVRLGPDQFEAYAQQCTHLSCAVFYKPETRRLECPCHHGAFEAETGRVIQGPPPRPLPRIVLWREGGAIFAAGVDLQTEA